MFLYNPAIEHSWPRDSVPFVTATESGKSQTDPAQKVIPLGALKDRKAFRSKVSFLKSLHSRTVRVRERTVLLRQAVTNGRSAFTLGDPASKRPGVIYSPEENDGCIGALRIRAVHDF